LLAAHKLVICAAFFGYVRLFVPLLPFAFLLQAAALAAGAAWMAGGGGRMRRRLPAAAGLALAALLLLELGIANTKPRNYNASGSADGATGKLLQDAEIRLSPKE
jgi:hypothetical protein